MDIATNRPNWPSWADLVKNGRRKKGRGLFVFAPWPVITPFLGVTNLRRQSDVLTMLSSPRT